jgi:Protein of unknown function (DUF2946)
MFPWPANRSRRPRRSMAVLLAYALALQGLIASVGLGMSAASAADHIDLVLCSSVVHTGTAASPASGGRDKNDRRPQCPFCFVAAQSAGFPATPGVATVVSIGAARNVSRLRYGIARTGIVASPLRRSNGNPRAPPRFSA